jgi:hypothetical protein
LASAKSGTGYYCTCNLCCYNQDPFYTRRVIAEHTYFLDLLPRPSCAPLSFCSFVIASRLPLFASGFFSLSFFLRLLLLLLVLLVLLLLLLLLLSYLSPPNPALACWWLRTARPPFLPSSVWWTIQSLHASLPIIPLFFSACGRFLSLFLCFFPLVFSIPPRRHQTVPSLLPCRLSQVAVKKRPGAAEETKIHPRGRGRTRHSTVRYVTQAYFYPAGIQTSIALLRLPVLASRHPRAARIIEVVQCSLPSPRDQ